MDVEIVNDILSICVEQQTCLFEVTKIDEYRRERNANSNPKYVIASVKNYTNIFKLSRDQTRIEFVMPVSEKFDSVRSFSLFSFLSSKSVEIHRRQVSICVLTIST